jgi:hypothetical protein
LGGVQSAIDQNRETMSASKGSFLFVALPPEGLEKSLVYQDLKGKVANAGNPLGEISTFPIPQFKVALACRSS